MVNLRSEKEIKNNWRDDIPNPQVSICCITYNHENYIEDALEGFLIQETNFPFEILIHDDASTDRTADIIREYKERYPHLIKPIFQSENQYSQNKRAIQFLMPYFKGKYIAFCEGDDYWTDPQKLQTQFDFLESNQDYVICGHDAFIIDEKGTRVNDSKLPDVHKRDYSGEDLIMGKAWILTMSWMFRNVIREFAPERNMVINGDIFLISLLGHHGKSKYLNNINPAAYRSHSSSVWSKLNDNEKRDSTINTFFWIYRYYNRIGASQYAFHYWKMYSKMVIHSLETKTIFKELVIKLLALRQLKDAFFEFVAKINVLLK